MTDIIIIFSLTYNHNHFEYEIKNRNKQRVETFNSVKHFNEDVDSLNVFI